MSFGGFGSSTPATGTGFTFGTATSSAVTPIKSSGFGTNNNNNNNNNNGLFSTPVASASQSMFGTPAATTSQSTNDKSAALTFLNIFSTPASSAGQPLGTPAAANQSIFGTSTTAISSAFGATPASTSQSWFGTPATSTQQRLNSSGTRRNALADMIGLGSGTNFNLGSNAVAPNVSLGGFGGFGTSAATSSTSAISFGTTNTQQQKISALGSTFGGFGTNQTTNFNNSFNFGGLGTGGNNFSGFASGVTQSQQQLQSNPNYLSEALYHAVFNCQLFNDERDTTMSRWNLIQALWGMGKVYYSVSAPPLELNQENPLCRFKAIGYSRIPDSDNNDGLIVLCFSKTEKVLRKQKQQLISCLSQILGNKPNLLVTIDNIKTVEEVKCQVVIFVSERGVTGSIRKIPANELFAYFTQNVQKQQLIQLEVQDIYPQVKLDSAQVKDYLENPPCSIDPRLWKQAQLDNPNPEHYIPVPMIGFQQVKYRLKCQQEETSKHRAFLDLVTETIQNVQRQHTTTQARLKEHRRTLLELQHRVLQVLVRQEITRKNGFSLQPEEELLTNSFEAMNSQISAPTQFKGRISEMLSQLRMKRHTDTQNQERYTMDPISQDDIKAYLDMEQQGMGQLIETVNLDLKNLKIIKDGMSELISGSVAT